MLIHSNQMFFGYEFAKVLFIYSNGSSEWLALSYALFYNSISFNLTYSLCKQSWPVLFLHTFVAQTMINVQISLIAGNNLDLDWIQSFKTLS